MLGNVEFVVLPADRVLDRVDEISASDALHWRTTHKFATSASGKSIEHRERKRGRDRKSEWLGPALGWLVRCVLGDCMYSGVSIPADDPQVESRWVQCPGGQRTRESAERGNTPPPSQTHGVSLASQATSQAERACSIHRKTLIHAHTCIYFMQGVPKVTPPPPSRKSYAAQIVKFRREKFWVTFCFELSRY